MRVIFTAVSLFLASMFLSESSTAQNTVCFERPTLNSLQKFPVQSSKQLLTSFGWTLGGNSENPISNYFDVALNYNSSYWYYSGKNLFLLSQVGKPNLIIFQTDRNCFNSLLATFSAGRPIPPVVDGNVMTTSFKINENTIEFREYKNEYSSRQYSVLLYNTLIFKKDVQNEKNRIAQAIRAEKLQREREIAIQKEKDDLFDSHYKKADSLFNLNKFQDAKTEYQLAYNVKPEEYINENIANCDVETYKDLIAKADQKFNNENYEEAIKMYNSARKYTDDNYYIDNRIKIINQNILNKKITNKIMDGDSKFKQNLYDEAISIFNEVLVLDPNNAHAFEMVKSINRTKEILRKRSTEIFSYKETNQVDYKRAKSTLYELIANKINESDEGQIELNYKIGFDTLGNDRSALVSIKSSEKELETTLNGFSQYASLTPSKYDKYYVASIETINLNSNWNTTIYKVKSKRKRQFNISELTTSQNNQLVQYLNTQPNRYGKFKIKVKSKEINDAQFSSFGTAAQQNFSDMSIVGYRTKAGPMSFIYSAILPGSGSLKVSYGKKGVGRMVWFLLNAGVAYASRTYSEKQYNLYKNATDQTQINNYYQAANISHQISLATAGIAASIYVYDIIWSFSRGCKNLKQSRALRKSSFSNPIYIQTQNIK